jgi:hypothetical protein
VREGVVVLGTGYTSTVPGAIVRLRGQLWLLGGAQPVQERLYPGLYRAGARSFLGRPAVDELRLDLSGQAHEGSVATQTLQLSSAGLRMGKSAPTCPAK